VLLFQTQRGHLLCDHGGRADPTARQSFVTIGGSPVLTLGDPVGVSIKGCVNNAPAAGIKPCLKTLPPSRGHSAFIRIAGRPVCLSSIEGFTDGTPPGVSRYAVRRSGQDWVRG
jgi:hypothetical protein